MRKFSREIRQFGVVFSELQILREEADYDLSEIYFRSEVLKDIQRAERVIKEFKKSKIHDRKAFVTYATTKYRR
ncbi:MAG: hypothetical protein F4Y81_06110 [Rhodothermaceae bacterium]|nr:hypothetical protein [Bacteroidota bacterium]MXW32856.1 hypothetical protein [Rhodothermaceae bacterium]MXZ17791.1 hypothetical protein [Rhodothermaceae bacterium]MYE63537.1 hypothetical protein [Rhodothermaceae bacterium]MYG68677.1 hypothetical protein [Rhodothermaceae bacterium]